MSDDLHVDAARYDRRGGWSREPFTSDAPVQVCTCEPDDGG